MVGRHQRLNGHEFWWAPGVGDSQGGLACCSPWGGKESDTTGHAHTHIGPSRQSPHRSRQEELGQNLIINPIPAWPPTNQRELKTWSCSLRREELNPTVGSQLVTLASERQDPKTFSFEILQGSSPRNPEIITN